MAKRLTLREAVEAVTPVTKSKDVAHLVNRACKILYTQAASAVERVRIIGGLEPYTHELLDEQGYKVVYQDGRALLRIDERAIDSVLSFIDSSRITYDVISLNDMYSSSGYDVSAFVDLGVYERHGRFFLVPESLSNDVDENGLFRFFARVRPAYDEVNDVDDLLPFTNVEPIITMVESFEFRDEGDIETSQQYYGMALSMVDGDASRNKEGRRRNVKTRRGVVSSGLHNIQ